MNSLVSKHLFWILLAYKSRWTLSEWLWMLFICDRQSWHAVAPMLSCLSFFELCKSSLSQRNFCIYGHEEDMPKNSIKWKSKLKTAFLPWHKFQNYVYIDTKGVRQIHQIVTGVISACWDSGWFCSTFSFSVSNFSIINMLSLCVCVSVFLEQGLRFSKIIL